MPGHTKLETGLAILCKFYIWEFKGHVHYAQGLSYSCLKLNLPLIEAYNF
jgi:hypothetical protein